MKCSCGGLRSNSKKDISWEDDQNQTYLITEIPVFTCSECDEILYTSFTQINISYLADGMKKGNLPKTIRFQNFLSDLA